MKRLIVFSLVTGASFGLANADTVTDIQKCAAVKNAAERLFCYDNLAASLSTPAAAAERPAPAAARSEPPPPKAKPEKAAAAAGEEDFGLEMKKIREGAEEIQSRYDGKFEGWDGDTIFRLENGQVWQQTDSGRLVFTADRPLITIRRGWFGAYYLKVQGANKSIRVKRIK